MKRLVLQAISLCTLACGAPRPSPPPPPLATIEVTSPPSFADSPVTALADELCTLALDLVHARPPHFHRVHFASIERHVSSKTPLPEAPCLAVVFDTRIELHAPPNAVHGMQTAFVLTRRRLTASTHGYFSTPTAGIVANTDVFPEVDRLYASFVDAVATGHANIFQTSETECHDLGVSENGKCERDMSEPVVTPEIAAALTAPTAKDRTVRLSSAYAFARAGSVLVRMQIEFDYADLVFEAETRGP